MNNMNNKDEYNNIDAAIDIVNQNHERKIQEEQAKVDQTRLNQEKLAAISRARTKSLTNSSSRPVPVFDKTRRRKKIVSTGLKVLAVSTVIALVAVINSVVYKDTCDFNKACDYAKEQVYEVLLENDLATRDEDGNILIDNTIDDYYRLDLAHADKYEKYAYYIALGEREFNEAIQTIKYTGTDQFLIQNGYYTTTNVHNGLDLHGGRFASESKFTEDVRDEYIEAYRNGTLDEIVRDDPIKGRSH